MKKLTLAVVALLGFSLFSCGGNGTNDIEVTPSDTTITGELKGFYTINNRTYKLKEYDYYWGLIIDVVRTELDSLNFDKGSIGFGVEILDKDGNVLVKKQVDTYDSHDEYGIIRKLKPGEKASLTFDINDKKFDPSEVADFRVLSEFIRGWDYYDSSTSGSSESSSDESDSADSSSSSASSEDWDAVLDSYEEYVDQYISLMKKAQQGDMTALTEYPALLEKANDFGSKLSSASSDLSTSQMARYTKITAKITKAAM